MLYLTPPKGVEGVVCCDPYHDEARVFFGLVCPYICLGGW